VGRAEHAVEPELGIVRREPGALAVRVVTVHRAPDPLEDARRLGEGDEVQPGGRLRVPAVGPLAGRPTEWVVERVEVGTLDERRPGLVPLAVVVDRRRREPRLRLERRAVPDDAVRNEAVGHLLLRLQDARVFRQRLRAVGRVEPRPERRPDSEDVVAFRVPRVEIFIEMREVHHRPVLEVAAGPLVGRTLETLEIRDPARAERTALRRREPEEELRVVRDRGGAGNAGRGREAFRQPRTDEPAADARRLEHAVQLCEQPLPRRRHVRTEVTAQDDGDVVALEHGRRRIAREPNRVGERGHTPAHPTRFLEIDGR